MKTIYLLDSSDLNEHGKKCPENPNYMEHFDLSLDRATRSDIVVYESPAGYFKVLRNRWVHRGLLDTFVLKMRIGEWLFHKTNIKEEEV